MSADDCIKEYHTRKDMEDAQQEINKFLITIPHSSNMAAADLLAELQKYHMFLYHDPRSTIPVCTVQKHVIYLLVSRYRNP